MLNTTAKYRPTKIKYDTKTKSFYIILKGKRIYVDPRNLKVHKIYKKIKQKPKISEKDVRLLVKKKIRNQRSRRIPKVATKENEQLKATLSKLTVEKNELERKLKDEQEKNTKKIDIIENKLSLVPLNDYDQPVKKGEAAIMLKALLDKQNKIQEEHKIEKIEHKQSLSKKEQEAYKNKISELNQKDARKIEKINREDVMKKLYPMLQNKKLADEIMEKTKVKLFNKDNSLKAEASLSNELFKKIEKGLPLYYKTKELTNKKTAVEIFGLERDKFEHPEKYQQEDQSIEEAEGLSEFHGHGTTNLELNQLMDGFPGYYGCILNEKDLNECLNIIKNNFYKLPIHSFIYRIQDDLHQNGHWVCFWFDLHDKYVGYFDSLGMDAPDYLKDPVKSLIEDLDLPFAIKWKWNGKQIEPDKSDLCGLYCTEVLTLLYYDHPWKTATNFVTDKQLQVARVNFDFL